MVFVEHSAISAAEEFEALADNNRRRDEARRRGQSVPESVTEAIQDNQTTFQRHLADIRLYIGKLNGLRLRAALERGLWQFLRMVSPARTLRRLSRRGGIVTSTQTFFNRVKQQISNIRDYARRWS